MDMRLTTVIADGPAAGQVVKIFDTPRLHLRPLRADDEALYCHLYTDPGMMRHIGAPLSAEAALHAFHKACGLAAQPAPAMQLWTIVDKQSGAGVGLLARVRHGEVTDTAEIGAMLAAAGQGRGYAAEALAALMDRLFALPGIRSLWTAQAPDNAAAARLMHRLGFERMRPPGSGAEMWRWQMDPARWDLRRPRLRRQM